MYSHHSLNDALVEILSEVYQTGRKVFPQKIKSIYDIKASYQIFINLRKTSTTRALEMKIDGSDIDIVNRWEGVEAARGRRPGREMKYHYADVVLMLKPFLRYSLAH